MASPFGLLPFGDVAPWGGPGTISLITVLPIGTNEIIAFFTDPPKCRDPLGFRDSRNALNWEITPIDPIHIGIGGEVIVEPGRRRPSFTPWIGELWVDDLDPTQVHIRTVPRLEPGIEYDVTLAGQIRGAACETFSGLATFRIRARNRPTPLQSRIAAQDTYRDFANPVFVVNPDNGQLVAGSGVWQFDEASQIVLDDAMTSLKKRVLRRIKTEAGAFVHLPNYGLRSMQAQLARPGEVQAAALRLQEQIKREPDVLDAGVSATVDATPGGGLVRFVIRVQARSIGEVSFLVQVPATG